MGWFDKKSWQLRRKIRDLQAELANAERDGKYVVEQGLFFAELQEMGDQTMMVLGTADHLDAEEETVIRNFFGRNGFAVENMRLDKSQKTLAAVEIIPPQELTRRVAKQLKEDGYRLIDDSDQERPSLPPEKQITLSGLIRAISALFAAHVNQLIINTPIKMNMEGNRLLHWMPLVRDFLVAKCGTEVVNICREPFVNAYNHYYGQLGRMEHPEVLQTFVEDSQSNLDMLDSELQPVIEVEGDIAAANREQWDQIPAAHPDDSGPDTYAGQALTAQNPPNQAETLLRTAGRQAETGYALASIYKSLIGASNQRRIRNAEVILDSIARFFTASSACLISRSGPDAPFSIQSNSPGPRCIQTNRDGAVCTDTTLLSEAIATRKVVVIPSSGNGSHHPEAVIAPLSLQAGADAVIFLSEPKDFTEEAPVPDSDNFALLARVFREFPDLLVADFTEKDETAAAD